MSTVQEAIQLEQEYEQEIPITETQLLERPISIINGLHEASHAGMVPNMMDAIEIAHQSDASFRIEVKTIDPPREKESNDGKAAIVAAICGIDRTCADKCCELGNIPKAQIRVNLINELKLNDPDFFNRPDASKIIRARVDEIASQQELNEKNKASETTEPVQLIESKPKKIQSPVAPAWAKTFTAAELEERKKQLEGTYIQGEKVSDPKISEPIPDKKSEQVIVEKQIDIKPVESTRPISPKTSVQIIDTPIYDHIESTTNIVQKVASEPHEMMPQSRGSVGMEVESKQLGKEIGNEKIPSPTYKESPVLQQPEVIQKPKPDVIKFHNEPSDKPIVRNIGETTESNLPRQKFVPLTQSKPEIKKPSVTVEPPVDKLQSLKYDQIVQPSIPIIDIKKPQTKSSYTNSFVDTPESFHLKQNIAPSLEVPIVRPTETYIVPQTKLNSLDFVMPIPHIEAQAKEPLQPESTHQSSQSIIDKIITLNQPEYMQIPVVTTDQGSNTTKTLHINIDSQHIPQTVVQSMEQTISLPKPDVPNINLAQKIYSSFEERQSTDQPEPVQESASMEFSTVLSIKTDNNQVSESITDEEIKSIDISTHIATVMSNGSTETLFSSKEKIQIETAPSIPDNLATVITINEYLEEDAPIIQTEPTTADSESLDDSSIESSIVSDSIQIPDSNENNTVMIDTTNQNEHTDTFEVTQESNSTAFIPLKLAEAIHFFTELVDVKTIAEPSLASDEQLPTIQSTAEDLTESEILVAPIEPIIITIKPDQESLGQVIEQTIATQDMPPVMVLSLPETNLEEQTVPELIDNADNTEFEFESNNSIESFALFLLNQDEVFQFMFLIEDISSLLAFLHKYSAEEKKSEDSIEIQDIEVTPEELKNDTFGVYDDTVVMTVWPIVQFMLYIQNLQIFIPNQQVN